MGPPGRGGRMRRRGRQPHWESARDETGSVSAPGEAATAGPQGTQGHRCTDCDLDRPAWGPASTQLLEGPGRPARPLFAAGTDPPLSRSRSVLRVRGTRQPGHAWQGPAHRHAAGSFSGHVWKPARGGLTRRGCRTYYKATVIKLELACGQTHRPKGTDVQTKGVEQRPEVNPQLYSQ